MQSGDNEVLKAMQRRYNIEQFSKLIFKIKNKIPDAGIGLDVIIGFPNETEERFINTYHILNELPFSYLHVFTYSPRPDTMSLQIKNVIKPGECDMRSKKLRDLSRNKRMNFYKKNIGAVHKVLVEERGEEDLLFGLTENYIKVGIPISKFFVNKIIKTKITIAKNNYCIGEVLSDD